MAKQQSGIGVLRYLGYLTQFGLSVILPPVLCVLLAVRLCDRYAVGEWLIAVALAVGLVSAGCSFYKFIRLFQRINRDRPDENAEPDNPVGTQPDNPDSQHSRNKPDNR